jgi:hypothetical protein
VCCAGTGSVPSYSAHESKLDQGHSRGCRLHCSPKLPPNLFSLDVVVSWPCCSYPLVMAAT